MARSTGNIGGHSSYSFDMDTFNSAQDTGVQR
jgi:hypothetical protein